MLTRCRTTNLHSFATQPSRNSLVSLVISASTFLLPELTRPARLINNASLGHWLRHRQHYRGEWLLTVQSKL
jgi:hypothetical protein